MPEEEKEIVPGDVQSETTTPVDEPVEKSDASQAEKAEAEIDAQVGEVLSNVVPVEDEKKPEEGTVEKEKEVEKKEEEGEEIKTPPIPPLEAKTTRLDRRIAKVYIQNLLMAGEENVPTEEQILADLRNHSQTDKIASLNTHLAERRRLRGERPDENNFEQEDIEAIRESEKDSIRQEILQEEHEKRYKTEFVQFVDSHPELIEGKKEFNPKLVKAVETLWRGGMPINEAFETVTEQINAVKEQAVKSETVKKQKALSGAVSASPSYSGDKGLTWEDIGKIQREDPDRYYKMLEKGEI